MHELSLCNELLKLVDRAIKDQIFQKILAVHVELGPFSCVEPESLVFSFDIAKQYSAANSAKLVILRTEAHGECPSCGFQQRLYKRFDSCSECSYYPVTLIKGDDMVLKSVEVE